MLVGARIPPGWWTYLRTQLQEAAEEERTRKLTAAKYAPISSVSRKESDSVGEKELLRNERNIKEIKEKEPLTRYK